MKILRCLNYRTIAKSRDQVSTVTDYLPFGMVMSERSQSNGNYQYVFNGKENDNEVKGTANQQDYDLRIYDPRVARFLSVDPLTKQYPMLTPYQFASNTPIQAIDLDGLEEKNIVGDLYKLSVDMRIAPKKFNSTSGRKSNTTYNLHGYPQNNLYFWESFINKYDLLDEWNKGRVLVEGKSPIVTGALKESFKSAGINIDQFKTGEVIDHHHINQKGIAGPLSRGEHKKIPVSRAKNLARGTGVFAPFILDITGFMNGDPESIVNWFDNKMEVGKIKKDINSGAYYVPISIKMETNEYQEKTGTVLFSVYGSYEWDDNLKKYVGQDQIGYGWKYEVENGFNKTVVYDLEGKVTGYSETEGNSNNRKY